MNYKKGRKLDLEDMYSMKGKKVIIGEINCERICTIKLSKNNVFDFNMNFLVDDENGFILTFEEVKEVYGGKYDIPIYEYIEEVESKPSQHHYKLWEILKMIDDKEINDTDIITDNKDLKIEVEYMKNGNYDLKYLLDSSFTINKKGYLTFEEAKNLHFYIGKKYCSINELLKEMDEKTQEKSQ